MTSGQSNKCSTIVNYRTDWKIATVWRNLGALKRLVTGQLFSLPFLNFPANQNALNMKGCVNLRLNLFIRLGPVIAQDGCKNYINS